MTDDRQLIKEAHWLYEAARSAGLSSDPKALVDKMTELQRGLPAEDEFAALCIWSGRCLLIHRLWQEQYPASSRRLFQVPDFFVVFAIEGHQVPALVEVKSTSGDELVFSASYHKRLVSYASALGLPLLIAWKAQWGLWALFDVAEMQRSRGGAWRGNCLEIMKQTLMGVMLGDFFANVRAGVGITMKIRIEERTSSDDFIGTVVASHWHNAQNQRVEALEGNFLPLLLCCPDEVETMEEDDVLTQRFYLPTDNAVPAHQTMVAGLLQDDEPNWHALLASRDLEGGLDQVRKAAVDGTRKGMVSGVIHVEPRVRPPFLPQRKRRQPRHLQPPAQEGGT
jgi:Holliday junction resolvase